MAPRGGEGRAPPPRRPAVRSSPSLVWRARSALPVPGDKGRFRGRRPQVRKGGFSVAGHNVDFSIQAKRSPLRSRLKGNVSDVAHKEPVQVHVKGGLCTCSSKGDCSSPAFRDTFQAAKVKRPDALSLPSQPSLFVLPWPSQQSHEPHPISTQPATEQGLI